MDNSPIDIILRTCNSLGRTIACIDSIYEFTKQFNLTVIDGSTDLTPQYLAEFAKKHDNFKVIHPEPDVKCFNEAINLGLKNTTSEFVVGMANTIVVEPDWLQPMVALMKQMPDIGIIQPKHLTPFGTIENAGIVFEEPMMHHQNIGVGEAAHRFTHIRPIQAGGFCCVLFRRKAIEHGLETDYYIGWNGFDDVDACLTLGKREWKIMYCGYSAVYHYAHATRGNPNTWSKEQWDKYDENRFRFLTRWASWGEFASEKEDK